MENQSLEYKLIWKDKYLCQICAFANTSGGRLLLGVRDDGKPIGLENVERLLADLPHKIKNHLDAVASVKLVERDGVKTIEIDVEKSSYPVNYNGEYYVRIGSTTQLLRGRALTDFLNKKSGILWDACPVSNIPISQFDAVSFEIFKREAVRKQRIDKEELNISNEELLDHLNLLVDGKPSRAAVLLFYNRPGRLVVGSYLKIAKFDEKGEILFQDALEGSLFRIADQAIDLVFLKYLSAKITYDKDVRVETYPYPREAVREAVYNAICHNRYADSVPIQIRVNPNSLIVYNSGKLPDDWSEETLLQEHPSRPYNPSIANAFYRAGYIENWGRGIKKICDQCRDYGLPTPEFSAMGEALSVKFFATVDASTSASKTSASNTSAFNTSASNTSASNTSTSKTSATKTSASKTPASNTSTSKTSASKTPASKTSANTQLLLTPKKKREVMAILQALKSTNFASQKELAAKTPFSYSTIQRVFAWLIAQGILIRVGGRRYPNWEIDEQNYAKIFGQDE